MTSRPSRQSPDTPVAKPPFHLLALLLIAILAISLRSGNLAALQERYALDNDSYRFLRIAEASVAGRPIPARDPMRWLPEGRDMRTHLSLHSHVMAGIYRALRSVGLRQSFRSFAIRYPIFCFVACVGILYALIAHTVSPMAGLIAAFGLTVAPATTYRSSAGFIDRDPFCLLLILCAYAAYTGMVSADSLRLKLAATVLCGLFSAALGLAWEGVGLFTVVFAVTLLWRALSGPLRCDVVLLHLCWCILALPPLLWLTWAYRDFSKPYVALALLPVPLASFTALLSLGWQHVWLRSAVQTRSMRYGFSSLLLFAGAGLTLIGLIAAGFLSPGRQRALWEFVENAISPLGSSILMQNIAELQDMTPEDWWIWGGPGLLISVLAVPRIAGELGSRDQRRGNVLGWLALGCTVTVMVSNELDGLIVRGDGKTPFGTIGITWGGFVRLVVLFLWFLGSVALCAHSKSTGEDNWSGRRSFLFFLVTWWFVLLCASAGAVRYTFFLVPVAAGIAASEIAWILERFGTLAYQQTSRLNSLGSLAIVLIAGWSLLQVGLGPLRVLLRLNAAPAFELAALTLVSILGLWVILTPSAEEMRGRPSIRLLTATISIGTVFLLAGWLLVISAIRVRSENRTTVPTGLWLFPFLERLDRELPKEAVILSWWEYGSDINVLAQRSTIIDEDHVRPSRISEIARKVYCAEDPEQIYRFLTRNGITHWLVTGHEMRVLSNIASVAHGWDTACWGHIVQFRPASLASLPASRRVTVSLSGLHRIEDPVTLSRLGVKEERVYLSHAELQFFHRGKTTRNMLQCEGTIVVLINEERYRFKPEILSVNGKKVMNSGQVFPGILLVGLNTTTGVVSAAYVPKWMSRFFVVRVFALREEFPFFRRVTEYGRGQAVGSEVGGSACLWEVKRATDEQFRDTETE